MSKKPTASTKALEIREHTFIRWRNQYGRMKADDAKELRIAAEVRSKISRSRSHSGARRSNVVPLGAGTPKRGALGSLNGAETGTRLLDALVRPVDVGAGGIGMAAAGQRRLIRLYRLGRDCLRGSNRLNQLRARRAL